MGGIRNVLLPKAALPQRNSVFQCCAVMDRRTGRKGAQHCAEGVDNGKYYSYPPSSRATYCSGQRAGFPPGASVSHQPGNHGTGRRQPDIQFDDGSSIELSDFYTQYSQESMPDFEVDGTLVAGTDFFNAFGPDLMPAAGPGRGRPRGPLQ